MRLGGPVFSAFREPTEWVAAVQSKGYRAAYCPLKLDCAADEITAYARTANEADLIIAEVGAWSNPLSSDPAERQAALTKCKAALHLADRIGARCAVNITGSRGTRWDGPHPKNLTNETFDMIVDTTRAIIDEVQPSRARYALETMPWMYPDSVESYVRLIAAIDRPACAVHMDPVNLVSSPQRYFFNGDLMRQFVRELGPRIVSCHAKDTLLTNELTTHLQEARPGQGYLDYRAYLRALDGLDRDLPLMIEHLPNEAEYDLAAAHIRSIAALEEISL